MKKAALSPCALCDADEAMRWYDSREHGLGAEFVKALDECIGQIERHPDLFRVFSPPYRKVLMRRFPFQVVYEIREDCLWVLAVYHAKRDPEQLRKRLSNR